MEVKLRLHFSMLIHGKERQKQGNKLKLERTRFELGRCIYAVKEYASGSYLQI
jgi:hypothetical protein